MGITTTAITANTVMARNLSEHPNRCRLLRSGNTRRRGLLSGRSIAGSVSKTKRGNKATSDLANLDLLRPVAVLLVFIVHVHMMGMMRIRGLSDSGHFGVLLFFVHTALVLMLSMERLGLSGSRLYAVFVVRRIFRICPLSILAVLHFVAFRVPSAPCLGASSW
jgi:hypothetical protein